MNMSEKQQLRSFLEILIVHFLKKFLDKLFKLDKAEDDN